MHGGGFYHSQKYRVAPRELPEPLHWFKWEAYTTWLSGFALLVLLYWLDADDAARRPGRRRPRAVAGGRRSRRRASRSPGSSTTPPVALLRDDRYVAVAVGALVVAVRVRRRPALRRRAPPSSRSARCSGRSWPRTSSSSSSPRTGSSSARSRRARARPGAGPAREAALGAQQLPDAAGRLHDARRPLPAHVRPATTRGSSCSRSSRSSSSIRHFFNLVARRAAGLVAPRGGRRRRRRARDRARAGRAPARRPCRSPTRRRSASSAERCATCHSGASAPLGVRLENVASRWQQHADAIETHGRRARDAAGQRDRA